MSYNGLYAADGSLNVTVLSSPNSFVGLHAVDGSLNVVASTGGTYVGRYHPSGAWYVTNNTSTSTVGWNALDGSLNVSASPYYQNTQRVTVVSGSFITIPGVPLSAVFVLKP